MLTTFAPAGGGDEGCGCQPPACIQKQNGAATDSIRSGDAIESYREEGLRRGAADISWRRCLLVEINAFYTFVIMHPLQQILVFLVALASLCPLATAGADAGDVLAVIISIVIAMVLLCAFLGWYSRRA